MPDSASAKVARRHCRHESKRADGWLDTHCLRCGRDGYWEEGQRVAEVEVHPSGKVLLRRVDSVLTQPDSQDTPNFSVWTGKPLKQTTQRRRRSELMTDTRRLDFGGTIGRIPLNAEGLDAAARAWTHASVVPAVPDEDRLRAAIYAYLDQRLPDPPRKLTPHPDEVCRVCGSVGRIVCTRDDEHTWDACHLECDQCGNYPFLSGNKLAGAQAKWRRDGPDPGDVPISGERPLPRGLDSDPSEHRGG